MKKILIVYANYYPNISKSLRLNSEKILKKKKIKFKSFQVSGVFEIPVVLSKYINKYDAFIALGCVIKRKNKKGIEAAMAVATILFNEPK